MTRSIFIGFVAAAALIAPATFAQGGRGGGGRGGRGGAGGPAQAAQAAAPQDFTGYWVALVTEDWLYRMRTPPKDDIDPSVPVSQAARQAQMNWDPAKDEAAGEQCRWYGAASIMRVPTRLHITWQDENTLKVETDAGTQTRLFHFTGQMSAGEAPSWQGWSAASWDGAGGGRGGVFGLPGGGVNLTGGPGEPPPPTPVRAGSIKVSTTNMKAGYLRKNGIPYSGAQTRLTEYYDRVNEPNGDVYLIISTTVEDPQYLTQPYLTSTHFKKESDGSKWSPSACTSR